MRRLERDRFSLPSGVAQLSLQGLELDAGGEHRLPQRVASQRGAIRPAIGERFTQQTVRGRIPAQRHLHGETAARLQHRE